MASVTGSKASRSYWHSTETVEPPSAAATPSSKSGSCSTPVTGRSAQLMSTATRRPGNPSCRQAAIWAVSQSIARPAPNSCPASSLPSHSAAASCPAASADSTAIPRRASSEVARCGAESLTQTTFSPQASPSRTNAAVRSNRSSGSPKVRHAWSSAVRSVI